MSRRRDTYRGGSTIHIPSRDSRPSDEGPPEALARMRAHAELERAEGDQSRTLLVGLGQEVYAGFTETKEAACRAGSSLPRFQGLNWRARLSEIIALARREGNLGRVKVAQAMMGRMAKAEAKLARLSRYPEEGLYGDDLYWFMAWMPKRP